MSAGSAGSHQLNEGRLITADNLIRAARNLGLNEVDLLLRYELIALESVLEYVDGIEPAADIAENV